MKTLIEWFTLGRAIALGISFASGAVGTGVGFLIAEGSARESFRAQFVDHDKRLSLLEAASRDIASVNQRIIEGLAELKGEVRGLRKEMRP